MPQDFPTRFDGIIVRLRNPGESAMFAGIALEAINKIYSKPVGKKLIDGLVAHAGRKKFGYTVCIQRPKDNTVKDGKWTAGNVAVRISEADACNGTGSVTAITWNANVITTPDGARPSFVGLAHEMIHALHNLRGEAKVDTKQEEFATVGLGTNADDEITENAIRGEHGVPKRAAYSGL